MSRSPASIAGDALLLTALYAALALAAIHLSRQPGSIAVIWFANALGIAFLATATTGARWPLALATMAGNLIANLGYGDPVGLSLQFAVANTAEVMAGAWLLGRGAAARRLVESPRRFLTVLALGGLVPQLLGATLGAAVLQFGGFGRFEEVWIDWYVGSALGAIVVLPLALKCRLLGARLASQQLGTLSTVALALFVVGVGLLAMSQLANPFLIIALAGIVSALILPPVSCFLVCSLVGATVATGLAYGLLAPPLLSDAWQMQTYLPALLSVLPAQLLAVARDQQRRASIALAALTSAAAEIMLFFDMDNRIRIVNQATENYWQRRSGDMLGLRPADLVPADQRSPGMEDRVRRALAGEPVRAQVELVFPQRGKRVLDVAYTPTVDDRGRQIGVIFTAHDVTELIETQRSLERTVADLRQANEGLEQFARISAHDLREPLNTILQFNELIELDHGDELPSGARAYFGQVRQGALRMRTMLDDLLQFVRLEQSEVVTLTAIDLSAVVRRVMADLQARVDACRGRVVVGPLPPALAHESLIALLLQNLISNGLKFVPPDRSPEVHIEATEEDDRVILTVSDNGIGIPVEDLGKLFQPFKRLHARRKFDGTGLGLAISRRIVGALGGSIAVESEPGRGSRFIVTLQRP